MRDVVGFEGKYAVTSCGKIWSYRRNKFLNTYGGDDYQMVGLYKDGKTYFDYVHRIVAKAYIPNPDNLPDVNHKDEVRNHNWANNLEWCTRKYNINYGARIEKIRKAVYCVELDKVFDSALTAAQELGIHASGITFCVRGKIKTTGGYHWQYAN
jgi:hypothetical protein